MTEASIDIERIVREVLAQLQGATGGSQGATGRSPGATGGLSASVAASGRVVSPEREAPKDELALDCRVVTLSAVEGRLAGVHRLVVLPEAVVTPSVRDELRRRNVKLELASVPSGAGARSPAGGVPVRLVMVTAGKRFDPAGLIDVLGKEAITVEAQQTDCLIEATDRLAAELLEPETLGLLWTRHVTAGLCLANRHPGVRAVTGTDVPSLASAAVSVGANLAIIDPAGVGFFRQKQMAIELCRGGARPCPNVFQERLA